jgi:hypothetical protein
MLEVDDQFVHLAQQTGLAAFLFLIAMNHGLHGQHG